MNYGAEICTSSSKARAVMKDSIFRRVKKWKKFFRAATVTGLNGGIKTQLLPEAMS